MFGILFVLYCVMQFGCVDCCGIQFVDYDVGGQVGQVYCGWQFFVGGKCSGQGGDDCIVGIGDVEYFLCLCWQVQGWLVMVEQGYVMFVVGYQ